MANDNPTDLLHLSFLEIKDKKATYFVSCKGVDDPANCIMKMTLDKKTFEFSMAEIENYPDHFECICNDFELPESVQFLNKSFNFGLAVISVTILVDGNANTASNGTSSVVFYDPDSGFQNLPRIFARK